MKGLLFMGILGYALGTLFAPKKGSELREDIKNVVADLRENGSDAFLDAQARASELLDKANPTIDSIKEKALNMKEGAMHMKESAMDNAMQLKESAIQVKEGALKLKENAAKSFQDGYSKEQAAAKQRKMEEANFDPSNSATSTASSF
ncbi:MAG: YtxH domain-containing protein [Candidatus Melainabacteria bacterium]|nr:MAG: YtxH domain-containing protein [Candidatus Melainabacteria bacterium]